MVAARLTSVFAVLAVGFISAETPTLQNIPAEPGLYFITQNGTVRIEGQVISFERTGSLIVSGVTARIKARQINFQLPGKHSKNVVNESPAFFYRMSPELIQQGAVETGATGLWRTSKGISIKRQIETEVHEVQAGLFRINPAQLKPGE